ncbi:hypothetical protein D3C87_1775380 [compost metagenome]
MRCGFCWYNFRRRSLFNIGRGLDRVEVTDRRFDREEKMECRIVVEFTNGSRQITTAGRDRALHQAVRLGPGKRDERPCRLLCDAE